MIGGLYSSADITKEDLLHYKERKEQIEFEKQQIDEYEMYLKRLLKPRFNKDNERIEVANDVLEHIAEYFASKQKDKDNETIFTADYYYTIGRFTEIKYFISQQKYPHIESLQFVLDTCIEAIKQKLAESNYTEEYFREKLSMIEYNRENIDKYYEQKQNKQREYHITQMSFHKARLEKFDNGEYYRKEKENERIKLTNDADFYSILLSIYENY